MPAQLRSATTSIVLSGHFNPAVFHPYWFEASDLLPGEQVAYALESVQSLSNELMAFDTEWLTFQAIPTRCAFTSRESAYHLELRDLVLGTLTLLPETPVIALGLNRDAHYRMATEQEWHAIGDRFVPNEPWAAITGGHRAGLLRLSVQVARDGSEPELSAILEEGATNIQVGPSEEAKPNGVFVGINDHFQLAPPETPTPARLGLAVLEAEWEPARDRANSIIRHIIE